MKRLDRSKIKSTALGSARRAPSGVASRWVRDDAYLLLLAVMFWFVYYQNMPSGIGEAANIDKATTFTEPNQLDRVIKLTMLAVAGFLIARRWLLARALVRWTNPGLLGFFVLAPASMLWSMDPPATLLRFISLAAVMLICFAVGLASWHPRRFQQIAVPPVVLILFASLAVGVISPALVTETGDDLSMRGSWHGLMQTKNSFGMLASYGTILCTHAWLVKESRTRWSLIGAAGSFVCLVFSRSNTSLFATLLAIFTMVLILRVPVIKQKFTTHVAVSISSVILIYEMAIQNLIPGIDVLFAPIASLTGKDATFSARTVIWKIIKEHIQLSPYLGSGYGAYWTGATPGAPSYIFMTVMYFYPTESHNGYLEVINDLGYVGLVCLVVFLAWYLRHVLVLMRTDRNQATLYLGLLIQEGVINMSESDWFSRSDTFSILTLGSICMSRSILDARLRGSTLSS